MRFPHRPSLAVVAVTAATSAAVAAPAVFAHGDDERPGGTTPSLPSTIALPNGFQPEGIATDGKQLYVGSIPTGAIFRANPVTGQGSVLVPPHDGRAAIGLKVAGKKLVVAGGTTGHAYIYDARTGADVADVPLTTGNSFINDVAISKCGAFFTDSRQPQLYRVTLDTKPKGWGRGGHEGRRGDDDRGGHGGDRGHAKRFGGGGGHRGHHGKGHRDSCSPGPVTPQPTTPQPTTPEPTSTLTSAKTRKHQGSARAATTIPITGAFQYDDDPATNEANGIVALPSGKQLIVVQSRTGKLFKVDARTGNSVEVPVDGGPLANGDGLLLFGRWLFVVQNRLNQIAVVKLDRNFAQGKVKQTITSPQFRVPTTLALNRFGLYTVNARFGTPATPDADYDIVRVPLNQK